MKAGAEVILNVSGSGNRGQHKALAGHPREPGASRSPALLQPCGMEDERALLTGMALKKRPFHLAPKEGWRYDGAPAHESN